MRHIGRVTVAKASTEEPDQTQFWQTFVVRALVALVALVK
jgi:hypothetical protein